MLLYWTRLGGGGGGQLALGLGASLTVGGRGLLIPSAACAESYDVTNSVEWTYLTTLEGGGGGPLAVGVVVGCRWPSASAVVSVAVCAVVCCGRAPLMVDGPVRTFGAGIGCFCFRGGGNSLNAAKQDGPASCGGGIA